MKKKHSSELYASLTAKSVESNSSDFEVLSLRVSHKCHAMAQVLNVAFQHPALTLFTDRISQDLADKLIGSLGNEPLIIKESENGVQPGSALDLLVGSGAIKYDDEGLRRLRHALRGRGK